MLGPRFIGPFRISARACKITYWLDLSNEFTQIHNTLHVPQFQKCVVDEFAVVPLDDIQVDDRLNYMERPVEILDRNTKALHNKEVSLVKVQ